jgi:hypothetical protein
MVRPCRSRSVQKRKSKPRNDPVKVFLKSCASDRLSDEATAAELHQAFAVWAKAQGLEALSPTALGRRLSGLNAPKKKRGGIVRYQGVALAAGSRLN